MVLKNCCNEHGSEYVFCNQCFHFLLWLLFGNFIYLKNLFVQVCTVFIHFLLSLVNIFMTITLNSLSDRLLISVSLKFFLLRFWFCFFIWNIFLCSFFFFFSFCLILCIGFYELDKTATAPSFEGVDLCRRWKLLLNPALALVRLSKLCDCLSSLSHF